MPAPRYKQMNMFERAQYDKAAALLREGSYKAAAAEFDKLTTQFPDVPNLSRIVLLRGYCQHQAKNRNAAIKIYGEVLDFFADQVDDASFAQYQMGRAHIENGDLSKGLECMKALVDSEKYQKQPVAAGALRLLADNFWKNGDKENAVRYWKQVVRDFSKSSLQEAAASKDSVTFWYCQNKDLAGYESWRLDAKNTDDPAARVQIVMDAVRVCQSLSLDIRHKRVADDNAAGRKEYMKAVLEYLKSRQPWFDKAKDSWTYLSTRVHFAGFCADDKKDLGDAVDAAAAFIKAIQDKDEADKKWSWMVETLCQLGDFTRADYVVALIKEPLTAAWRQYTILTYQEKWSQAAAHLETIEKMGDNANHARAMTAKAGIYMERLGQYEKAIKLFQEINKPPSTLWNIAECYRRWGKKDQALATLTEIENMFPDEAPDASWKKATIYQASGDKKRAISQARGILKAYPKSPASSRAHRMLESYGVDTGGGVKDDQD